MRDISNGDDILIAITNHLDYLQYVDVLSQCQHGYTARLRDMPEWSFVHGKVVGAIIGAVIGILIIMNKSPIELLQVKE